MNLQLAHKAHRLGFRGLRCVISYLRTHPDKTHLVAMSGPEGVRDIVVTPQRFAEAVANLQKLVPRVERPARQREFWVLTLKSAGPPGVAD